MKNIIIITGSFHKKEAEKMVAAAKSKAADKGLTVKEVIWVPGSMEVPLTLKKALLKKDCDAVITLGIIEKGETLHGQVMGQAVTKAIIDLQLEFLKPVGFGILGPGIEPHQIPPRLENYARDAVEAVANMLENI